MPNVNEISKIFVNNVEYNIKDTDARSSISTLESNKANIPYGTIQSGSTSTNKIATVSDITELKTGIICIIKNDGTASASGWTLNVNGLGAKPVYVTTASATTSTTEFGADYTMMFIYDESNSGCWRICQLFNSDTTYTNMTQAEATTGTATTARSISAKVLNTTIDNKIANKVDKIDGKGLSTEDYTTEEKTKLENLTNELSSNYVTSTGINDALALTGGDTYEEAFGKLEKSILDSDLINAAALTDLNSRISEIESTDVPTISQNASGTFITVGNTTYSIILNTPGANEQNIGASINYIENRLNEVDFRNYLDSDYLQTSPDDELTLKNTSITKAKLVSGVQLSLSKADTALQSETQLSETITGIGNAFTNISVSGHNITLIKDLTFLTAQDISGLASETYVDNRISGIIGSAPAALDTLGEIATALNNDANLASTLISGLNTKVDKVDGKGLSTKDYTTADQTKLSGIQTGAQVNIIESISVNNEAQTITNKNVNITVPTITFRTW